MYIIFVVMQYLFDIMQIIYYIQAMENLKMKSALIA